MNAQVGADERLVVMLEARISEFEKRMQQAERRGTRTYQGLSRNSRSATRQMEADMLRSTTAINRAVASTSSKIGGLAKAFAGGIVGGIAVGMLGGLTTNISATVKGMAQISDEAKRAGMATQSFQEWSFVADQNRISVDALVDGFKELNLRADEFIVTGKGSAAEAFARLGFSADNLKRKLENPSELMLEIIKRMEGMGKGAQIRIADEIFGGTGGEQFVQLLGQGEDALRATIDRAHEVGAVMDDELIAKAEEIDRKFKELTATTANFTKRLVVGVVAAGGELTDMRERLDQIVSEAEGRSIFGDELYDSLEKNRDLLDENAENVAIVRQQYDGLAEDALAAGNAMLSAASTLDSWGYEDAANGLRAAREEMDQLVQKFRDGEISGEDFATQLGEIQTEASEAFSAVSDVDKPTFSNVISQLGALGGAIASVTSLARSMTAALASAAGVAPDQKATQALRDRHEAEQASMDSLNAQRQALDGFTAAENARNSATADQLRLQKEVEAVLKRAGESGAHITQAQAEEFARASIAGEDGRREAGRSAKGGGGKGASEKLDEYQKEAQGIRERTSALEAEAAVLITVAATGKEYGDALEFARQKAQLLHAAQQAGRQITPELEAEIDALADAYVQAGLEAEGAAQKLDLIKERSRAGKNAMTDLFGSIIDGSKSAKQAVADLLMEIAKTQMINGIMGLPGMGGIASGIGRLLIPGFAEGGYHTGGLRIVGENGPEIEATGAARYWSASQTQNMIGRASGGVQAQQRDSKTSIELTLSPDLQARILQEAGEQSVKITHESIAQNNKSQSSQQYLRRGR